MQFKFIRIHIITYEWPNAGLEYIFTLIHLQLVVTFGLTLIKNLPDEQPHMHKKLFIYYVPSLATLVLQKGDSLSHMRMAADIFPP